MRGACVLIGIALLAPPAGNPAALQSFYVARYARSDHISDWNDQILDVVPEGDGVRVRLVRISLANEYCDRILVEAVERVVPHTTPQRLAGQDLCTLDAGRVDAALEDARARGVGLTEWSASSVIATCGARESVIAFPAGPTIDWHVLKRRHPEVHAAGELFYRVRERVFGRRFTFDPDKGPRPSAQWESTGTSVVPYLLSGRFDSVLVDHLVQLKTYSDPPSRQLQPAELLERASLSFGVYQPVQFPPIALAARVHGDVRLRLTVDAATGEVRGVEALSTQLAGWSLLSTPAVAAARQWRFKPGSVQGDRVDVTIRFEPRCGS
jgi:TonB family protein